MNGLNIDRFMQKVQEDNHAIFRKKSDQLKEAYDRLIRHALTNEDFMCVIIDEFNRIEWKVNQYANLYLKQWIQSI